MYKLQPYGVLRLSDSLQIARDNGTPEWKEYEAWLAQGNVPLPEDPLHIDLDNLRRQAYVNESDPLFFKAQRGEVTMQEWLDKVAEIKSRWH